MSLSLVTGITEEPVTLDDQKVHLRLDTADDDAYVQSCITAARQWVEGQTHRALMAQTWDYNIDYGWPHRVGLHRIDYPINPVKVQASPIVDSITYVDSDGASQTLAADQYTIVARTNSSYIVPAFDVSWPTVRHVPNAITVRFVAGYVTVPQELHRAIMLLAALLYEKREPIVTSTIVAKLPFSVEALISPFRTMTF